MFVEHGLGPWPRRLAPDEALDYVRDRDTLVVTRMGRLVRNLRQIADTPRPVAPGEEGSSSWPPHRTDPPVTHVKMRA